MTTILERGPAIGRRAVLGGVAIALLGVPRRARAQAAVTVPRVGVPGGAPPHFNAFVEGMRAVGHMPGQTVRIDHVPSAGQLERLPALAEGLVATRPVVILASNPYGIGAAFRATKDIPVVAIDLESDPIAKGWVTSLGHPGGNVTGFFLDVPELSGKQLQFLKELDPRLTRVVVFGDPHVNELQFKAIEAAGAAVGLTLRSVPITDVAEIPAAFLEAARQRAGAVVVLTSPRLFNMLPAFSEHALKHRLPSVCPFVPAYVEAGGLLAYGPDLPDIFRRAAGYVDRILKGAKAGDLPVQRPEKFELAVNLKTARALKLTVPQSLLGRADRVIGA